MRKSFNSSNIAIRPLSLDFVVCDQFPLQEQNINPSSGFPRSDVSLFDLSQKGLIQFDGNRLSPLPDVGQRTTLDNPNRRYCDTLSEKQEVYVQEQLRKLRKKKDSQKPAQVEFQVKQPSEQVVAE